MQKHSKLKKQIAKISVMSALAGTSLSSILVIVLTFISGLLITRALGPTDRGVYGAVLLIVQTAATIGCLSFFDASVVRLQRDKNKSIDMLSTMIAVAIAITVLSTSVMIIILHFMDLKFEGISEGFLNTSSLIVIAILLLIQCFSSLERSDMNFWMINIERVGAPAAFSLMVLAVWVFYNSTLSATIAVTLFMLSKLPAIAVWLYRYRKHLMGRVSWCFAWDTFRIGLKFHIAVSLGVVAGQLDRLIAVAAWSSDLLGQYFVAFSAVGAGYSVITTAINTVLLPYLGGLAAEDRSGRISQIIRLTLLVTTLTVLIGWLIIPLALPLLYGPAYMPAVEVSLWLLLALSVLPLRAVVLETGRSLGKGRPSIEMAVTSIVTMYAGYLITGFTEPSMLIAFFGLSHLLSTVVGARHMIRDGDIRFDRTLVPAINDIIFLKTILHRVVKQAQK